MKQWGKLVGIIGSLQARDPQVVMLGDFNATGPANDDGRRELAALADAFAPLGLTQVGNRSGCSAYWDGRRRDAWKEPSLIDLVWVSGFSTTRHEWTARAGAHCQRHGCEPMRSTEAYPDRDLGFVSDHCPIVVDMPPPA
jgi:endonuclease/exonuclease/phosphatase family metal-dependent hydrolase